MSQAGPRRILITGATDGIGMAIARKYAIAGHHVLATGRRPLANPQNLFGDLDITYVRADQTEPYRSAVRIEQAVESMKWQGVDLAIINAGIGWVGDPVEETMAGMDAQLAVNLRAPVQIVHRLAERLLTASGQVVFIGSVAHTGTPRFATYAATKAGLHGLARSLREEWRGKADVQMLHPGAVRTGMHAKAGLEIGLGKYAITGLNRSANAIMSAIESPVEDITVKRFYIMRHGWRVPKSVRRMEAI